MHRTTLLAHPGPEHRIETFVRAHIDNLPGQIGLITELPCRHDGLPVLKWFAVRHALRSGWAKMSGNPDFADEIYTHAFDRVLRRVQPQVVLAEYGHTAALLSPACQRQGIPLVAHFHGMDTSDREFLDRWAGSYQRLFATRASLVAVSRDMQQRLLRLGAKSDAIEYCPYGVDTNRFTPSRPAEADRTLVAVGRLVEKKAPHLLLRAFSNVAQRFPDARLHIIGEGPLRYTTEQLCQELNLQRQVQFLGARSHDEVVDALSKACAFVQHSVVAPGGDSEGTPVAILEAAAMGLPIIATRHAGITEAVIEGETGLLSDENDVESMSRNMMSLCQDPDLAAKLGSQGRIHIVNNYGLGKSIQRLRQILDQAAI